MPIHKFLIPKIVLCFIITLFHGMAYWIPLGSIRGWTGVFMVKSPEKDTASSVRLLSTIGAQAIPK